MRLQHCDNLQTFYDCVMPFLQQREAEHNMLLSYLGDLLREPPETPPAHSYMGYVETEAGEVVAAAHYSGYRLSLSHPRAGYEKALDMLLDDAASPQILHVVAPSEFDALVLARWPLLTGRTLIADFPMHVYRLETVILPVNVAGTLRQVTMQDSIQVRKWMIAFEVETFGANPGEINEERLTRWMGRFLASDVYNIVFWEFDGQPVAMAGTVGRSPTGMRIGLVYTPPEQRGHGYASAVTAALSQSLLDSGLQFCTLNTDTTNPTSNKIYQAIGYYKVADQTMCDVEPVEGEE
jgi:uncharacterized protein